MKKKITFISMCFIALIISTYAQPTINTCNTSPVIGDSLVGTTINADTTGVSQGAAGVGITWDFSNLVTDTTYVLSHYWMDPQTCPGHSNFPNAEVTDLTPVGIYSYYSYSPDSSIYWGNYESTVNCVYAYNPQSFKCPFSYQQSQVDTFYAYRCGSYAYTHIYTIRTITYDSYGTLMLPIGTYSNVIRFKIIDNTIDSTFLSNGNFITATPILSTAYQWINTNCPQPYKSNLLFMLFGNSGGFSYKQILYYNIANVTLVSETNKNKKFEVYPNPFRSSATIKINSNYIRKNINCIIYNLIGKEVMSVNNYNSSDKIIISSEDLPNGMYFYKIINYKEIIGTGKMIIE